MLILQVVSFLLGGLGRLLLALVRRRLALALENLALRQQLAAYERTRPKPKLRRVDRIFWVWLSRLWSGWRSTLLIVKPETVIGWHRQGFRLYWRWKSRSRPGRPAVSRQVIALIHRMCRENPTWGAPRIQAELALLGHDLADSTVAKYMLRPRKPPSQTWRTFLKNHVGAIAACDFFVVPTVTFQLLYALVIIRHDRRRVVHFGVTAHPTAAWISQQLREAFPFDEAPRFLIRDNDGIYGEEFQRTVENLGVEEVRIAPHSPWQNPYCERLIGSVRRECLDHIIILDERHLRRTLKAYFDYYLNSRTHLALDRNAPNPREVEPPSRGSKVIAMPHVGGLHHRYVRCA
jgi:hypothetical protein